MSESLLRKRAVVRGRVQGVAFRYSAREVAAGLGLRGWIRNLPDGRRVETVFEGSPAAVEAFLAWLRRGPPRARVDAVEAEDLARAEELGPFEIRRTP
ncbi:MAG: acylphosphatase [Planctomycetota bacterium]|nr:MAG: acylphosphatase [Planctomycetota bacterium]